MKSFTHEYMKENCGCYKVDQLMKCSFMQSEPVTLKAIIDSEIPIEDKFLFLCKKVLTKEQNQRIAIELAKSVLHIYENEYPEDKRVMNAIQGAEDYYSWYVAQDQNTKLWCVAKSFDTYSDGGLPTGLKTIIDSEHNSEESARKRLNEIRWS